MRELYSNASGGSLQSFTPPAADPDGGFPLDAPAAPWHALTVKHQHERTIEIALTWKGFEAFSPMYRARRRWSDRTKEIELPLFAGYVFCRFPVEAKGRVLDTPAVSRVVQFGGTFAAVPDRDIEAIRAVVASKLPVRPWPHLKPGDRVRIERGPLRGIAGVLLKEKDELQLIVSVELLQRSVAVQIDAAAVLPQPSAVVAQSS